MPGDRAAFGLPEPEQRILAVAPECHDAVRLFAACGSQWRYGPDGCPTGLDYAGCRMAALALGIDWLQTFPGLRAMEAEARGCIRKRADAAAGGAAR